MNTVLAHARLLLDIFSTKMIVWIFGRDGELLDSHLPHLALRVQRLNRRSPKVTTDLIDQLREDFP